MATNAHPSVIPSMQTLPMLMHTARYVHRLLALAFIVASIMFPASLQTFKILFLVGMAACFLVSLPGCRGTVPVARQLTLITAYYAVIGVGFVLWGMMNGGRGTAETLMVYVLGPVAYWFVIQGIDNRSAVRRLHIALLICTFVVSVLVILKMLSVFGYSSHFIDTVLALFPEDRFLVPGRYSPRIMSSLLFLAPYSISSFVLHGDSHSSMPRSVLGIALAPVIVSVIISGRNVLLLVILILPILLLVSLKWLSDDLAKTVLVRIRRLALVYALTVTVAFALAPRYVEWSPKLAGKALIAAFNPSRSEGARVRFEEAEELMASAAASPLVGHGLGKGIDGYVRDSERPWRYELRPLALLAQVGVIGLLLYLAGLLWMYRTAFAVAASSPRMAPAVVVMMVSITCVIIGDATNPYLDQVGRLWMLFMPIGVLNASLLSASTAPLRKDMKN